MEMLSAEKFRRKLAKVIDESKSLHEDEKSAIKQSAIDFCAILPELFSEDFDRKTLWTRIGNGLISSIKKCGGDCEEFINLILEFIKADLGQTAANVHLDNFLSFIFNQPQEWKKNWLQIIEKKHYVILVYARYEWTKNKSGKHSELKGNINQHTIAASLENYINETEKDI